jgi:hypothetical protein
LQKYLRVRAGTTPAQTENPDIISYKLHIDSLSIPSMRKLKLRYVK